MNVTAHCERCGAVLPPAFPAGLCPACLMTAARREAPEKAVSRNPALVLRRFGDYELLEELGRGGMGVVYRARQISLNRSVALKMILSGPFSGPEAQQRFHAEAEAAANLRHVHIVTIFDYGELEGVPYYTMEYVEGRTLGETIGNWGWEMGDGGWRIAKVVRTIAEAVHYAHQQGVLHRDLKPSNVLIDSRGEPRVTDFGLAKYLWDDRDPTLSGQLLGSPNYMSPEQAAGNRSAIGPASDVYALGAILYELLTGRPPFGGKSITETLRQVVDHPPVLPRALNPRTPRDLQTICLKCLEKDSRRRYATAREFADELQRFIEGEPIHARPVRWWERSWRWARRKPALASALGTLALVFAIGFAGVLSQWHRAERNARAQRREAYFSGIALANKHLEAGDVDLALSILLQCPPEFRHWEWGRLVYLCHQDILTIQAVPDPEVPGVDAAKAIRRGATYLTSLDFSGDGRHLVAQASDGRLRAWEIRSNTCSFDQPTPLRWNKAFAVRPDSDQLAVISASDSAEVWSLSERQRVGTLAWPGSTLHSLQYTADGRHLLTVSTDRVALWSSERRDRLWEANVPEGRIDQALFTGDGTRLSLRAGGVVRVHAVTTGTELGKWIIPGEFDAVWLAPREESWVGLKDRRQLTLGHTNRPAIELNRLRMSHENWEPTVVFSPNTRTFCCGGEDGTARVWDAASGKECFAIPRRVHEVVFSPDGRYLLTTGNENVACLWDAESGQLLRTLSGHAGVVRALAFNRAGNLAATGGNDGLVKLWSVGPGREVIQANGFAWALAASLDLPKILCAPANVQLASWDADTGRELDRAWIGVHAADVAAFSPDGTRFVTGGVDKMGHVWDAEHFRPRLHLRGHTRSINAVAWSANGRWIATASRDGTARLWDAERGTQVRVVGNGEDDVGGVAFSSDSQWAVSCHEKFVQVWSVPDGRPRWQQSVGTAGVMQVAYSPRGTIVVGCCRDSTIRTFDARTGATRGVWATRGFSRPPTFSPDGKRLLVTGSRWSVYGNDRGGVELWDIDRGTPVLTWEAHPQPLLFLSFSQGGRRIVTGSFDKTIRQWEAFPWSESDYPRTADDRLIERIRSHARTYWQQRIAAEGAAQAVPAGDPALRHLLDRSLWPKRDPRAQPAQIDLTEFYTGFLTSLFYPSTLYEGGIGNMDDDLSELGTGLMDCGEITFDARGVIQLRCRESETLSSLGFIWNVLPERVAGIPIGRRIRRMHCLQAAALGRVPDGTPVASWVWHYQDGSQAETEVIYGRDLRGWWKTTATESDTPGARVVWTGTNPVSDGRGATLRLFLTTYENPQPDRGVVSLEYQSKMTLCAPFLVALTVE